MTDVTDETPVDEGALDEQILVRLGEVGGKVDGLSKQIGEETETRKTAIKWNRLAIAAAFLIGIIGVAAGTVGVVVAASASNRAADAAESAAQAGDEAARAQAALAAYIAQTQVARVASCNNSNVSELKQANAEIIESHDLVAALVGESTDPAVQQRADKFNVRHDKLIGGAHSLRDCSPAGIAKFLHQQANP